MNSTVKNVIAVVAGLFIGGMVNSGIVAVSGFIIPPPEGADLTTTEGLKASMHLMEPKHFLMPFLAHALGTFVGALVASLITAGRKMRSAMIVGIVFLLGGTAAVIMLPSPLWFTITDLVLAYLPMAFIAAKLIGEKPGVASGQ